MRRKGHRRKGIRWDYNWDGVFARERIKGFWKRYWKRWRRREENNAMKKPTLITISVLLLFCLCMMLVGLTEAVAQAPPEPTRISDAMIEHPVRPAVAFYVVTPYGREFAVPDSSIVIDFEADPPTVRAVCESPPPTTSLFEVNQAEVLTAPKYVYALDHVPVATRVLKVYRTGMRLIEGIDYAYTATSVTITQVQGTVAGDKIQITYFRE